ncbi:sensor histidine kinase [Pontibacter litorisediminis]|uniref:sensor histidine kinase n=1 Tax=Pontibacter litorisediminis TaxID=1846260 RepID=UPI0023EC7F88|nr:HAMP domain-containing sensor histidine kinase [Pontibacter litorisediminis]
MKLLHIITRTYLLASLAMLVVGSLLLFLILQWQVQEEVNEELALQEELVVEQIRNGVIPRFPLTQVRQVSTETALTRTYGDSVIYDHVQQREEDYRYLRTVRRINGKNYALLVMDAHVGWGEYYVTIFLVFLVMGLLLGVAGTVANYFLAKRIWQPFFQNLATYRQYQISSSEPLSLHASQVEEFQELQSALLEQTRRGRRDFLALREFTENASHEIQTPLAILQSKLDRLSQYPLSEEVAHHLALAKASTSRLSRINKGLLLLAKLDNRAFEEREAVDVRELLQAQLEQIEELFSLKGLLLQLEIAPCVLQANRYLMEILLSNLLSNALRHTSGQGRVSVLLSPNRLTISNPGSPLALAEEQLFERFKKERSGPEQSTGLGLAIAKEICNVHGWPLQYSYSDGRHYFTVRFA